MTVVHRAQNNKRTISRKKHSAKNEGRLGGREYSVSVLRERDM